MYDGLWQAVLGELELTLSRGNFVTWFKNTRLLRYKDDILVIGVPNIFIKNQLEKKYSDTINEILERNGVHPESVEYKVYSPIASPKVKPEEEPVLVNHPAPVVAAVAPMQRGIASVTHSYRQGINERYTFDNFIVGSGSELAYAACQGIALHPGTKYNPLFVYGGVGIGKTHLIQAVGNAIIARDPGLRVVYVTIEQFVQEFLDAIRYKKAADFAGHYRSADVLIVDDIQFIAGKEKTQEEFFHTFNALHQANKQIIISSDKPPRDIPTLEERLRSRFAMGMTVDMQAPDFETRCAILQTKATTHDITLPPDVVEYLAHFVQSNVRELEGTLNHVLAQCEIHKITTPDLTMVTALLGNEKQRPKHLTAKHIIEKTARYFQVPMETLLGPKRDKDIVVPRQIAMYLLRSELHLSFPKIAHELGRKDHTTALHSIDKIEQEQAFDLHLRSHIQAIKERLYV